VLVILVLVAVWPLLLPGELRGGELGPWPETPAAFLGEYVSGWNSAGTFGTAAAPSPAQAVLGLLQVAVGGSSYLAPRVLLVLPLFVGWLLALRAGQTYSRRRVPRVVAATAYVLSPPALAALVTGQIAALVVLAVLPGIVAGWISLARARTEPARAWRAVAAVALLSALAGAFEPRVLVVLLAVGVLVATVGIGLADGPGWRIALLGRAAVAVGGPVVLLLPWSLQLFAADGLLAGTAGAGATATGDELWRWLLLAPSLEGFPGLLAGVGFVLAGILGLALGTRRAIGLVAALWTAALLGAVGGWWLDRTYADTWAGLPLLVTAAAFAGLFALAFATGERQLARHAFGWRQIGAGITVVAVVVSITTVAGSLVTSRWEAYAVDDPPLPSFIEVEADDEGPFRVLLLADTGDEVTWEVVDGTGPTMASYGVPTPPAAIDTVGDAVSDLLARRDPMALDALGVLNVRYVLVPPGMASPELARALLDQTGAEPEPVPEGQLLSVTRWLPRAAAVSSTVATQIEEQATIPVESTLTELEPLEPGRFRGEVSDDDEVIVAEMAEQGWRVTAGGATVRPESTSDLVHFDEVPGGTIDVEHAGTAARNLAVTGQLLAVLLAVSLALRPPGFARAYASRGDRAAATDPAWANAGVVATDPPDAARDPQHAHPPQVQR
ncbi:MAG: hypothetical protein ACLFRD_03820, partial [Nitriliruptoraceae bacterium]